MDLIIISSIKIHRHVIVVVVEIVVLWIPLSLVLIHRHIIVVVVRDSSSMDLISIIINGLAQSH